MHTVEIKTREGSSGRAEETDIILDGKKFGGVLEANVSIVASEPLPLVTLTFCAKVIDTKLRTELSIEPPKS